MTSQEFLDLLHGPNALIYFQVGGKTWKNKPQTVRQAESKLRWRNDQGDDVCFLVNSGGTRDTQITRINAAFIDWDCGRDNNGKYFPDDVALARKEAFLPSLHAFAPSPSIIVETRNGFHAYWLLKPGVTADQFRVCQKRLALQFQSDGTVSNPARVMRVPGFDWVKPGSGCARFKVRILHHAQARHLLQDILAALPKGEDHGVDDHACGKCSLNKCKCTSTLALIEGAKPVSAQPLSFTSVSNALDYLKEQDLKEYLTGTGGAPDSGEKIACPFHADSNPSAGVFRAGTTGHWMFKCHACDIAGTILDMAMRVHKCSKAGAIKHLFERYNIEIDTGWKAEQGALLQQNLTVINDADALRDDYPCLYRLIGRVRRDLASKIKLAQDCLVSERSQVRGQAVFFSSLRNFHRASSGRTDHPRYCNRQNEKVDRYCLLGLMRKLSDSEVPPALLKDAIRRKALLSRKYRIQFFTIPAYTTQVLERANNRACNLIEAGVSVRGISPELVLDLFGQEVVQEVYPQLGKPGKTVAQVAFRAALEQAVVSAMACSGYTTISQLRDDMRRHDEWASVTARRIEKCLPGILVALNMVKRTCNQQIKQCLGLDGAGYPKVIVPQPKLEKALCDATGLQSE